MGGADGVKIAVLRKDRASLELIWAAAHAKRSPHVNTLFVGVIDNGHKYWYYAQHEIR